MAVLDLAASSELCEDNNSKWKNTLRGKASTQEKPQWKAAVKVLLMVLSLYETKIVFPGEVTEWEVLCRGWESQNKQTGVTQKQQYLSSMSNISFVAKEEGVKQEGEQKVLYWSVFLFLLFSSTMDTTNNLIIQTPPGTEEILIRGESQ